MKMKYFIILMVALMCNINDLVAENGIRLDTVPDISEFDNLMLQGQTYQRLGRWQQALNTYQKTAKVNPKSGQPYIKIGMLYWKANENCSSFQKKTIAIESVRNFQIAEKMKDTQAIAKAKIEAFRERLPTQEDYFQRNLREGQKVVAGCTLKVIVKIPKLF